MKKWILVIILILSFLFLIFFIFKNKKSDEIVLYGNIEIRQTDLSFRVSGRILNLYKEEGDSVKRGDLLAELDDDVYKVAHRKAIANLKEKEADKIKKINIYNFNYPLCSDFTISKEKCSNLKYDMQFAKGSFDVAFFDLEKAKINLDDTKLYAPYDGIIISRVREKGSIVGIEDVIYSISMYEPVWVRAYIEEVDLGKVRLGQKALIYTDSRPKDPYVGQVGFVSPVAEFTPKTVETTSLRVDLVYRLRIIIDKPDLYLRQGMPVTIRLLEDE